MSGLGDRSVNLDLWQRKCPQYDLLRPLAKTVIQKGGSWNETCRWCWVTTRWATVLYRVGPGELPGAPGTALRRACQVTHYNSLLTGKRTISRLWVTATSHYHISLESQLLQTWHSQSAPAGCCCLTFLTVKLLTVLGGPWMSLLSWLFQ